MDWAGVFKIQDKNLALQTRTCLLVVIVGFCMSFPLSAAQKLAVALQLGWAQSVANATGSVVSLVLVGVAALLELSVVPFLVLALIPPVLVNIGLLFHLMRRLAWRLDLISHSNRRHAREIFGMGILFVVPQLAGALLASAPQVILSSVLGAAAAVPFNLTQRMLGMITQARDMMIAPLWPAYAEARSRGDCRWIVKTFRRSVLITVVTTLLPCLLFILFGQGLILFWTKTPESVPSRDLILLMTAWQVVCGFSLPFAMLLNGLGRLIGQATYGMTTAALAVYLMPVFSAQWGAPGIPIALITAYLPITFLLSCAESFWVLSKLKNLPKKKAAQSAGN